MLILLRHDLAFLATPKTGSTAIEQALTPHAEIIFGRDRKHITAQRYRRKVAPFLKDTFNASPQLIAVMREPLAQIESWYRYRGGARLDGQPKSTAGISFDQFVTEVISEDPPPRAQIGSQFRFLTNGQGKLLTDHLFAYESLESCVGFLSDRLGQAIDLPTRNVSPKMETALGPKTLTQLQEHRAKDFALYDALKLSGGHLRA